MRFTGESWWDHSDSLLDAARSASQTARSSRACMVQVPQERRASGCGSGAGVALRLRFAMRCSRFSAPLSPLADRSRRGVRLGFHRGKLSLFSFGNLPFRIVDACLREQHKASARARTRRQLGVSQWSQSIACACASTSQSSLSMPRETPVNKSAVSASRALLAASIARRVLAP